MKKLITFVSALCGILMLTCSFVDKGVTSNEKAVNSEISATGYEWSGVFSVSRGEEPSLGLVSGASVKITEYDYTGNSNSYYIEVIPFGPYTNLSEHVGGMWSTKFAVFKLGDRQITVQKNSQVNPGWIKIGDCELKR